MLFLKAHAFVKPLTVFHDHKSFIMCQHLAAHLSHITIVCPIIAINFMPGSHTNLLSQFNCWLLGGLFSTGW